MEPGGHPAACAAGAEAADGECAEGCEGVAGRIVAALEAKGVVIEACVRLISKRR